MELKVQYLYLRGRKWQGAGNDCIRRMRWVGHVARMDEMRN